MNPHLENNRSQWNTLLNRSPYSHLMQTWEWGEYKSKLGWKPCRFILKKGSSTHAGAQILFKSIPFTPWTIGYIPKGPLFSMTDKDDVIAFFEGLSQLAYTYNAVLIRMEPGYENSREIRHLLLEFNCRQISQTNQPRCTFTVDLSIGEAALFEQFSRNTRRLIRKAEKNNISIKEGSLQDIDSFYAQLTETAKRKRLPLQNQKFYTEAYRAFESSGSVKLLLAYYKDQIVSSLIVFLHHKQSMHLWAGNSGLGLKYNASHLLQWTAMKIAIRNGCKQCDLWGIPDEIADIIENGGDISSKRKDGLWGVYRFKEGFGGNIQCFIGTYDLVFRPKLYWLLQRLMAGQQTMDRISTWLHRF